MARAGASRGRGLFVTFEGGEGAGKSTQVERLRHRIAARGDTVVVTREPGGSPRAEAIRRVLLEGRLRPFGPFAETALFAAARLDHVRATIAPALARGESVLCDRFVDSTRVYQGAVAGVPDAILVALEGAATGGLRPDLTLILDLPAEAGMRRAEARRSRLGEAADRFETEGLSYHGRVRDAFLAIAAAEPGRCTLVDGSQDPDAVEASVWAEVSRRLVASAEA